ncbi:MAG: nucleotide-binding protein [Acidobacteria bacterium]|nr:nucleotide-binding protein [Acidobacteriota bacterium]
MRESIMILLIAAMAVSCGGGGSETQKGSQQAAAPVPAHESQQAGQAAPEHPGSEAAPPSMPPGHPTAEDAAGASLTPATEKVVGVVLESVDASGFTYIRLKTAKGETWAAVQNAQVQVGSTVTVNVTMSSKDFESQTLQRKFDKLLFGSLEGGMDAPTPAHAGAGPATVENIKVPKAEGPDAKTVSEVWAGKSTLKDKPVAVRGKVAKFLSGIMGKNWIHLRDGTGSRDKGDDDLTVTTVDTVSVGDVVLVRGTLRVDRDFGAGYAYPVIVEDATVSE